MYSSQDNRCSHRLGSPIRKSPDHRLLAPSRGFSQLATSFFAYLRQGIHTHALSSLTIKLILRSLSISLVSLLFSLPRSPAPQGQPLLRKNNKAALPSHSEFGFSRAFRLR